MRMKKILTQFFASFFVFCLFFFSRGSWAWGQSSGAVSACPSTLTTSDGTFKNCRDASPIVKPQCMVIENKWMRETQNPSIAIFQHLYWNSHAGKIRGLPSNTCPANQCPGKPCHMYIRCQCDPNPVTPTPKPKSPGLPIVTQAPVQIDPGNNKFGLNVAIHDDHVTQKGAKNFVQAGGWIVILPWFAQKPSGAIDANNPDVVASTVKFIEDQMAAADPGGPVNYVIRAHYRGAENFPPLNSAEQKSWIDFWRAVFRKIKKPSGDIYVMPLNEPNLPRECRNNGNAYDANDSWCAQITKDYSNAFLAMAKSEGLKVLSPALAISAPNFTAFAHALGGGAFFNQFDGVAMDYYDFETNCNGALCNENYLFNPAKFEEFLNAYGITKPMFMVETGLVSPDQCGPNVPDCPNFVQPNITRMLCELNKAVGNSSRLAMFSPLTYDPEEKIGGQNQGEWFFNTTQTQRFYLERSTNCESYNQEEPVGSWSSAKGISLIGRDIYGRLLYPEDGAYYSNRFQPQNKDGTSKAWCPALSSLSAPSTLPDEQYKNCQPAEMRDYLYSPYYSCPNYDPGRQHAGDTCIQYQKNSSVITMQLPEIFRSFTGTINICDYVDLGVPGQLFPSCLSPGASVSAESTGWNDFTNSFLNFLGMGNEYTHYPNYLPIDKFENQLWRTTNLLTDYFAGFYFRDGSPDWYNFVSSKNQYQKAYEEFKTKIYQASLLEDVILRNTAYQEAENYLQQAEKTLQEAWAKIPNLNERLQLTSGVLEKLMPPEKLGSYDNEDRRNQVLRRWTKSNVAQSSSWDKTAVGDYPVLYWKKNGNDLVFIGPEEFQDSLEKRSTDGGQANEGDMGVFRLSDFVCPIGESFWDEEKTGIPKAAIGWLCGKKRNYQDPWGEQIYEEAISSYIPKYTQEDAPLRFTMKCWSNTIGEYNGRQSTVAEDILKKRKKQDGTPDPFTSAIFDGDELTEEALRALGWESYIIPNPAGFGGTIVQRFYADVGFLPEALETATLARNLIMPENVADLFNLQLEDDPLIKFDYTQSAAVPVTSGERIAMDEAYRDPARPFDKEIKTVVGKNINIDMTAINDWRQAVNRGERPQPPTQNISFDNNCSLKVEIPFIKDLAEATIGKAGFYRLLLPGDLQADLDQGIADSAEKGAEVTNIDFKNNTTFTLIDNGSSKPISLSSFVTGSKLTMPYTKAIEKYHKTLIKALNPPSEDEETTREDEETTREDGDNQYSDWSFAVIGDTQSDNQLDFENMFKHMVLEDAGKNKKIPETVFHVGDFDWEPGDSSQYPLKGIIDVMKAEGSGSEVHLAPGNHDSAEQEKLKQHYVDAVCSGPLTSDGTGREKRFNTKVDANPGHKAYCDVNGDHSYWFTKGKIKFIMLEWNWQNNKKEWLVSQICDGTSNAKIIMAHDHDMNLYRPIIDAAKASCSNNFQLKAIFVGHGHHFHRESYQGVELAEVSGMEGIYNAGEEGYHEFDYFLCRVSKNSLCCDRYVEGAGGNGTAITGPTSVFNTCISGDFLDDVDERDDVSVAKCNLATMPPQIISAANSAADLAVEAFDRYFLNNCGQDANPTSCRFSAKILGSKEDLKRRLTKTILAVKCTETGNSLTYPGCNYAGACGPCQFKPSMFNSLISQMSQKTGVYNFTSPQSERDLNQCMNAMAYFFVSKAMKEKTNGYSCVAGGISLLQNTDKDKFIQCFMDPTQGDGIFPDEPRTTWNHHLGQATAVYEMANEDN